jgi:hypothetical protein
MPAMPGLPFDAVMSFIKQTRSALTWSPHDMSEALKTSIEESKRIITVLALQGYVKQSEDGAWITTIDGETISGSRPPRFSHARIVEALAGLRDRIKSNNADKTAPFRVVDAVAYGDFLLKQPLVQAADVGVALTPSRIGLWGIEKELYKRLRAGHSFLHLIPYQSWMSHRSHQGLI